MRAANALACWLVYFKNITSLYFYEETLVYFPFLFFTNCKSTIELQLQKSKFTFKRTTYMYFEDTSVYFQLIFEYNGIVLFHLYDLNYEKVDFLCLD